MEIDRKRVMISLIIFILLVLLKTCVQTKLDERKIKKSKDVGSYCLNNTISIPNDYLLNL